jgi:hypothetical protein
MKKSRHLLWICALALAVTGVGLYFMAPAGEGELPHPLNGMFRELHGALAALGIFMFGYLFGDHVQKKIHKHQHHWDGYLHLGLWILLVISGLLLYYPQEFLPETLAHNTHWYAGLALCLCFPLHFLRKRIKRWLVLAGNSHQPHNAKKPRPGKPTKPGTE